MGGAVGGLGIPGLTEDGPALEECGGQEGQAGPGREDTDLP